MSRVLQVSDANYRVKVQSGGKIFLDTGTNTGDVIITGNLTVRGNTTTVDTANMTIEDNIILLNKGETGGSGITETKSGIQIQRSENSESATFPDAQLVFDESKYYWDPITES